jgi:rubrerythrin
MAERSDADLLEDLLAVEARLASVYEAALRRGAIEPALGEALVAQERQHAAALERALAGRGRNPRASVPSPELAGALGDPARFARFALGIEAEAVAAYRDAAATIRDERLRQPLGSIMACEAAHTVALRESLGMRLLVD